MQSVIQSLLRDMQIIEKKKKKKKILIHTVSQKYLIQELILLISLRSDIDFGNHPNRTHFTDLFKSKIKHFKKIFLKLQ